MRLTEAQAKALGITDTQIREAKLTPTAAKLRPETPKAPPKDGRAMLHARLEVMYPGEVVEDYMPTGLYGVRFTPTARYIAYDLALPDHDIVVTVDAWGMARKVLTQAAERRGLRCFHYTSAALTTKAALDLACVEIGAAYGAQEGAQHEKRADSC